MEGNIDKYEVPQYLQDLKKKGVDGSYYRYLANKIHNYLFRNLKKEYEDLTVALMTIDHYQIKNKYPKPGNKIDFSWDKDVNNIIERTRHDESWRVKYFAILGDKFTGDDFFDDPEEEDSNDYHYDVHKVNNYWIDSNQYNNRDIIDGTNYYSDLDDIDDGWRKEF